MDHQGEAAPDFRFSDADGVLRSEIVGFGTADDKWVDDLIAVMEKARK